MTSTESGDRKSEVEIGGGDCTSVAREYRVHSVQKCEDMLRIGGNGEVAKSDWARVAENAVSVMECKAEETRVRAELERGGGGEPSEVHFELSRDV